MTDLNEMNMNDLWNGSPKGDFLSSNTCLWFNTLCPEVTSMEIRTFSLNRDLDVDVFTELQVHWDSVCFGSYLFTQVKMGNRMILVVATAIHSTTQT